MKVIEKGSTQLKRIKSQKDAYQLYQNMKSLSNHLLENFSAIAHI